MFAVEEGVFVNQQLAGRPSIGSTGRTATLLPIESTGYPQLVHRVDFASMGY